MIELKRLVEAMSRFDSSRVLGVGDIMLDQFVWGEVSRISPEAPVPVVEVQQETMLLGGAANVANNFMALGSRIILGGVVGRDPMGTALKDLAGARGIDVSAVVESSRPTTLKTRIVARSQQVVRVDRESKNVLEEGAVEALTRAFGQIAEDIDGIIVSDYAKGVVNAPLMAALIEMASDRRVPILVDPKPVNRHLYRGVTVVTPNRREAEMMAGMEIVDDESLGRAVQEIHGRLDVGAVLVTRGSHGMALWERSGGLFTIPTMAREVFDVTGAGDTVIATLALGLVNGLSLQEAAYLANVAAGVVVGKIGTATVSVEELEASLGG